MVVIIHISILFFLGVFFVYGGVRVRVGGKS